MAKSNFVFGYGSLVNINNLEQYLGYKLIPGSDFTICGLRNFRRCWNVAMNNNHDLPNYKYYRARHTGNRLDGFVTFLNIRPVEQETIIGVLFRVSDTELNGLDRRERNYYRVDMTEKIDTKVRGVAWVYIGLEAAQQRYQQGLKQQTSIISRDYFNLVHDAYCSLGERYFNNYIATTDKPKIPIVDLEICRF